MSPFPGLEIAWSRDGAQCCVHNNTPGFVTNLCSVLCLCSSCCSLSFKPQLPPPFKPNIFLPKSTLWNISDPAQTSLDLQFCSSCTNLSLVLQLLLPTLSCTESKFPFFWVAEMITDFLELKYTTKHYYLYL